MSKLFSLIQMQVLLYIWLIVLIFKIMCMFQRILVPFMLSIFLCKSTETDIKHVCVYVGPPWWQSGKDSPCQCGRWLWSLGWEVPLEKEMATHSSILAWEIPWTEEHGGLQSSVAKSHTWLKWLSMHTHTHTHTYIHKHTFSQPNIGLAKILFP